MNEKRPNALQKIFKDYEAEYHELLESHHKIMMDYERKSYELDQRILKRLKDEIQQLVHSGYVFVENGSPLPDVLKQGPTFFRYRECYLDKTADVFVESYSLDTKPTSLETVSISDIEDMVVLSPKDVEMIKKQWKAAKDKSYLNDAIASNVKAFLKSNNMKASDLKMVLDNIANED